ncbi:acyl-CoA thioesterase [bacterium]|nr:acyl-CoA thioesterase [bacterium]
MKILESGARIRFQDCDPFAHLNNARYIDYYLNARADQVMEEYQIDIFGATGISWLVGSNQIAYFKPAYLNEEVIIESQIFSCTKRYIQVEMRMFNADKSHLKSFIWVDSIPISLDTHKMTEHPEDLLERLVANTMPLEQKTFEERRAFFLKTR